MAKTLGGGGRARAATRIVGFKESEKAIQLGVAYSIEIAPKGGGTLIFNKI